MDAKILEAYIAKYPARQLKDTEGNPNGLIVTMPGRVQWPHLAAPQKQTNDDGVTTEDYSVALIIPEQADITLLETVSRDCAVATFGAQKAKALKAAGNWSYREQAVKSNFDGFGESGFWLSAATKFATFGPYGVGGKGDKIDPNEIYPGCWVLLKLEVYPYGTKPGAKKQGVKFGLRGVQKIGDDERLKTGNEDEGDGFEPIAGAKVSKPNGAAVAGASDDAGW